MISFGILVANQFPIKQTIELAKLAEKYEFDYFWVADENPSPSYRDVWVTYSAILHKTRKIKVATGINTPHTRHPALLAVAMNSFNELFPNRAHLGLGPGGHLTLHPLNIPMWERPIRAVREAFEIIQQLQTGQRIDYQGEIFQALDVKLDPKPTSIWENWLACRGPQMIKLGGRFADGIMLTSPPRFMEFAKAQLIAGCQQRGRSISEICIGNLLPIAVSEDQDQAYNVIKKKLCFIVPDTPDVCHEIVGIPLDQVKKICATLRKSGVEAAQEHVTPAMVKAYSLWGAPENIVKQAMRYFHAGVQHLIFGAPLHPEDPLIGVKILGEEVIPQITDQIDAVSKAKHD